MEDSLVDELRRIGLDEGSYRVLALLPLVHVAWADGKIQKEEAAQIEAAAARQGIIAGDLAREVLDRWLAQPPSEPERAAGMRLLVELARRRGAVGGDVDAMTLRELIDLCHDVAAAAGDLFGLADPVSREERAALAEIARLLSIDTGQSWVELYKDLHRDP
ncbi:MAG: hypothetical protein AAFV53_24585 [Myxococcota bacterium]